MQIIFFILLLSITGCAYGEAPSAELCERKFIEVVQKNNGLEKTLDAWNEFADYCPKDGIFEFFMARIYGDYEEYQKGLDYLLKSKLNYKITPRNLYLAIGGFQLKSNLKQDALVTINKLIEEYPDWYGGFHLKGLYLGDIGDIDNAQRYLAHAYLEKEGGNNGWTLMYLATAYFGTGDHERVVKAHILCEKVDSRVALFSQPGTDLAAISYIKTGRYDCAAEILSIQAHYDESAVNSPAFKKALKVYEETTGKPLDVVAYYEEHCKVD